MFGDKVGKIRDSIYHLKRGRIYTIHENTFLAFGGAQSIDKANRREGISWWPEELPTHADNNLALENLQKYNFTVDYILTHTCPSSIAKKILGGIPISPYEHTNYYDKFYDPTTKFLEHLKQIVTFKRWYFGHFHEDELIEEKFQAMSEKIFNLKKY